MPDRDPVDAYVTRIVDSAPPLTGAQRDRLRRILAPAPATGEREAA